MSEPLRVTLGWPPSVNHLWRNLGDGRVVLSAGGKRWRRVNRPLVVAAMLAQGARTLTGPVALGIGLHAPDDGRRRDISNSVKALEDLLVHAGALVDDCQVEVLRVTRRQPSKPGIAVLWLRAATPEDYADE